MGLDHPKAPTPAAAADHSPSPAATSEKSPSPAGRGDPARARAAPRKGAGPPAPTSHLPLQAADSNALQPLQRPRQARRQPSLVPAPTSSPAARHNPAAQRDGTGSGSRLPQPAGPHRGGTQRLPARPAAPRSLQPAWPASLADAHPSRPALAPPIGSTGCQATNNRSPHWSDED